MNNPQATRLDPAKYKAVREAGISFMAVAQEAGVSAQRLYTNARFTVKELSLIDEVIASMRSSAA